MKMKCTVLKNFIQYSVADTSRDITHYILQILTHNELQSKLKLTVGWGMVRNMVPFLEHLTLLK